MASAVRSIFGAPRAVASAVSSVNMRESAGLTPRQQALNRLWGFYRTVQYDSRKVDWNGRETMSSVENDVVAARGSVPPGFYSAAVDFPIKFRRPTAPYHLCKTIVDRFTGLLFSEQRHPMFRAEGAPDVEDYATALADASRLWAACIRARTFGGAIGSVAVGFKFVNGKPVVEVHDPRWLYPEFEDRETLKLTSIDKRYTYKVSQRDDEGDLVEVWYWYRRVITKLTDTLYEPVPVQRGGEPIWAPKEVVAHNFGFCPVLWVQNMPLEDDIDGDPDCVGAYDMLEAIDALLSQGNKGVIHNCDPTLVLSTSAMLDDIEKGSNNAIKLPDGTATYLELSGTGPEAAFKTASQFRAYALEMTQCVLEHPDTAARTATEVNRAYTSMLSKADIMREQYGQRLVLPLVEMMLDAARLLRKPVDAGEGRQVVQTIVLPRKVIKHPDGKVETRERVLPLEDTDGRLTLTWPAYFDVPLADVHTATQAATSAKAAGLIDEEAAIAFVAPYFDVEDPQAMLVKLREAAEARKSELQSAVGGAGGGFFGANKAAAPEPDEDSE